jgi:hypothetical protein
MEVIYGIAAGPPQKALDFRPMMHVLDMETGNVLTREHITGI